MFLLHLMLGMLRYVQLRKYSALIEINHYRTTKVSIFYLCIPSVGHYYLQWETSKFNWNKLLRINYSANVVKWAYFIIYLYTISWTLFLITSVNHSKERSNMSHVQYIDELVREYLLFRGFTVTLKSFDNELKIDKDKGFRVSNLVVWMSLEDCSKDDLC